jgi:GDPmannose 4,6-dehydratase
MGLVRLLEVLREVVSLSSVRFYQASTSEMFGRATESPQSERTQLRPRAPYGVSKAFAHQMVGDYRDRHGLFACSGILYNHESERRPTSFVVRKVTNAVARVSLGLASKVELGNLDAQRDWGFAGDYVDAMWRMLQGEAPDDYVVATGEPRSVAELVEVAFRCVGVEDWRAHVSVDQGLVRPPESITLTGDSSKARSELGWRPSMSFDQMIERMVDADLRACRPPSVAG